MSDCAYLWFDTEFTSLDVDRASLLQVSLVATSRELERIMPPGEDLNLYLQIGPGTDVSPFVEEHLAHVLAKCRSEIAIPSSALDGRVVAWLDDHGILAVEEMDGRPVIGGNTVYMDVMLARRLLPGLMSRVHYRLLDVSALKILWEQRWEGEPFDKEDAEQIRAWFPEAVVSETAAVHDAYFDVQASIAELAYYLHHLERREVVP